MGHTSVLGKSLDQRNVLKLKEGLSQVRIIIKDIKKGETLITRACLLSVKEIPYTLYPFVNCAKKFSCYI